MRKTADYRKQAHECLRLAHQADGTEHRDMLLQMSDAWQSLANYRERHLTGGECQPPCRLLSLRNRHRLASVRKRTKRVPSPPIHSRNWVTRDSGPPTGNRSRRRRGARCIHICPDLQAMKLSQKIPRQDTLLDELGMAMVRAYDQASLLP
jgi:hypothetical protein